MSVFAAAVAALVLTALAVLQVLLAAGRPYGRLVWGGQHETLPPRLRVGSAMAVLVYAAVAGILFWRSGALGPAPVFAEVATWVIFALFTLSIPMNAISRSRLESLVMTPVCAVLAVCAILVATSPR